MITLNDGATNPNLGREECEPIVCRFCGSKSLIKRGRRKNKNGPVQVYGCKSCGRRFTLNEDGFRKMEHKPEIVTLALDLYFKGISYRKIVDHLKQFYRLEVHHTTVLRWVQKFTELVKEKVDKLIPEVSGRWHVDEMMVNVDGNYVWLWNLMDSKTRFLLVSQLSLDRYIEDAEVIFKKAKERAGKKPSTIVTDGLLAYIKAYKRQFGAWRQAGKPPVTEHIRLARFKDKVNNNLVERLHGTVRERDKVMRALDTMDSAPVFFDAFQIYYNFLRPHEGLDGKTPAEAAGLIQENGNRWLSLLRMEAPMRIEKKGIRETRNPVRNAGST